MIRPKGISLLIGITYFKVILLILIIFIFWLCLDSDNQSAKGALDAFSDWYNLDLSNPQYAFGKLIGKFIFPILFCILQLVSIYKRKRKLTITFLLFELIGTLARKGFPLFSIIGIIIMFLKSSKHYFGNKDEINEIGVPNPS
jgi:hypothetical protein